MKTTNQDSAVCKPSLRDPLCAVDLFSPAFAHRIRNLPVLTLAIALGAGTVVTPVNTAVAADTTLTIGAWANYRYVQDDDRDDETLGDFASEALIIYADGNGSADNEAWSYSAELRIGPGSFSDPNNNSSGDNFTLHKAWIGWQAGAKTIIRFGKSQVPFGWKTVNFWPGDILQAGYGDQMDVGFKLNSSAGRMQYALAYYHADDWGERSTDTADDNGHWGSIDTYRKVQTFVGDVGFEFAPGQQIHLSAQSGGLQDLTGMSPDDEIDGDHSAFALWYHGSFGPAYIKAEYMTMERELPVNLRAANGLPDSIENSRAFVELGYASGNWFFYIDGSLAMPDTAGNPADDVTAFAPGMSYDYGPGWIYIEYLTQDGFVGRNGIVGEGDFDALYLSADFYL